MGAGYPISDTQHSLTSILRDLEKPSCRSMIVITTADCMKQFGAKIDSTERDMIKLITKIKGQLPKPGEGGISGQASAHRRFCIDLAYVINRACQSNIIDACASAAVICQCARNFNASMLNGMQTELKNIIDDVSADVVAPLRTIKRIVYPTGARAGAEQPGTQEFADDIADILIGFADTALQAAIIDNALMTCGALINEHIKSGIIDVNKSEIRINTITGGAAV